MRSRRLASDRRDRDVVVGHVSAEEAVKLRGECEDDFVRLRSRLPEENVLDARVAELLAARPAGLGKPVRMEEQHFSRRKDRCDRRVSGVLPDAEWIRARAEALDDSAFDVQLENGWVARSERAQV